MGEGMERQLTVEGRWETLLVGSGSQTHLYIIREAPLSLLRKGSRSRRL